MAARIGLPASANSRAVRAIPTLRANSLRLASRRRTRSASRASGGSGWRVSGLTYMGEVAFFGMAFYGMAFTGMTYTYDRPPQRGAEGAVPVIQLPGLNPADFKAANQLMQLHIESMFTGAFDSGAEGLWRLAAWHSPPWALANDMAGVQRSLLYLRAAILSRYVFRLTPLQQMLLRSLLEERIEYIEDLPNQDVTEQLRLLEAARAALEAPVAPQALAPDGVLPAIQVAEFSALVSPVLMEYMASTHIREEWRKGDPEGEP